jgi:hypothetical protein
MKCPHCQEELSVPENAVTSMQTYGSGCRTVTECCGHAVLLAPVFTYRAQPSLSWPTARTDDGDVLYEDDWGRPYKPTTKEARDRYMGLTAA